MSHRQQFLSDLRHYADKNLDAIAIMFAGDIAPLAGTRQ